ncbi:hypothetical protein RF11_14169 [Thelohanellus kitauei]|uniref:DDE-1 domain-containing protein n=1 Tax=Thelohanellus kitauei TaxID=669202 RepID=A0A0C2N7G8_THEKT|nr:hypothetical protein RF11_14169 [Thelohanellus kitauei]
MPRNDFTLFSKIALLDKIKSHPLKTKSQLREELVLQEEQAGTFKRKRKGKDQEVEEALDQWFFIVSAKCKLMVGYRDEKQDTKLNLKKHKVERAVPTTKVLNRGKLRTFLLFLPNFCADDIYNDDETGLCYRATPVASLCYRHIALNEENEDMLPVPIINYEGFSAIDNNLPCYDNNEDCDDLMVEDIISKK